MDRASVSLNLVRFLQRLAMDIGNGSTKSERKVVEKNRRNHMKALYSNLNSLLPNQNTTAGLPLPDQIDEAINYIKALEARLKKSKEKKESLSSCRKRSYQCIDYCESTYCSKAPKLEIRETGPTMEIVFVSGLHNHSIFSEIIFILHEEGVGVVSASYSVTGNSVFHLVNAKMEESSFRFGAAKLTERLNRLVTGPTSETGVERKLWEFDTDDAWGF